MATLTYVVYCLSQHPNVLLTLREELLTKIGSTRRPTFDDVKECKYLRAVINGTRHFNYRNLLYLIFCTTETLRLYPTVCVQFLLEP